MSLGCSKPKKFFPVHDANLKIDYVDETKNMAQRLIAGELDAMITDVSDTKMFESLEQNPKINGSSRLRRGDLDLYTTPASHAGAYDCHEPQTRPRTAGSRREILCRF